MLHYQSEIEVRYAETDAMGIVHHSSYAIWFELSRIQALRHIGLPYEDMEAEGYTIPVVHLAVDYLQPARFGDHVTVTTTLENEDRVRFGFLYEVHCKGKLLARGRTSHVFTVGGKPVRIPAQFKSLF